MSIGIFRRRGLRPFAVVQDAAVGANSFAQRCHVCAYCANEFAPTVWYFHCGLRSFTVVQDDPASARSFFTHFFLADVLGSRLGPDFDFLSVIRFACSHFLWSLLGFFGFVVFRY